MKLLSIDVGMRTLAMAIIEYENRKPPARQENKDAKPRMTKGGKMRKVTKKSLKEKKKLQEIPIENVEIKYWQVIDILSENNMNKARCKDVPMPTIISCLCKSLDKRINDFHLPELDYIVIERQPSGRRSSNQKMLGLSYVIFTYFYTYFQNCQKESKLENDIKFPVIDLFSAKSKGNITCRESCIVYRSLNLEGKKKRGTKKQQSLDYRQRKKTSIELCNSVLESLDNSEENLTWIVYFKFLKKKDDGADALCQALAFVFFKINF